jgi:thioredoxin reductase (NADPH)
MITTDVENYPGFAKGIEGPELMDEFRRQAERFGTEFMETWITEVDLSERPFQLYTDGPTISTETLIIATGASAKWLGIPGEAKVPNGFGGNGVSACATCDGPLPAFRNKEIVVVGGGDTAMEEATFLTRYASKVYVVHRRDKLRASKIMQDKAFHNEKIEFVWNTARQEISGRRRRRHRCPLRNLQTGEDRRFPAPACLSPSGTDQTPICSRACSTWTRSVTQDFRPFNRDEHSRRLCLRRRAGFVYRQAVTAAGTGCMSAIDANVSRSFAGRDADGEEVTMEGEHVTPDHKAIITPRSHGPTYEVAMRRLTGL